MRPRSRSAFSWRLDPSVPTFDDSLWLVVMDGDCALCSATARRIARLDRDDRVRICRAQSRLGRALLAHFGLSPDDPESWVFIREGRAYGSLDAMIRLLPGLHRAYLPLRALSWLPSGLQDWLYARIARNRYHFGKTDLCAMPDPELRRRLLE
ncbi:thiol-disulfide oxidoreductase DCC family protein [Sagittula sp. S175]|uniref:thiol-disulfide oxidoreductase DCC family protein n=1 Tax=Sagittula sp. S175 TaxID=3415129 RepID=UPI003C7DF2A1